MPPIHPRRSIRPIVFALFFASGFCSLLYQVVWLRIAFAQFGIITPVLSLVLSAFMAGLGLGTLAAGRWVPRLSRHWNISPAYFYGFAELLIGVGAFAVPVLFRTAGDYLLNYGPSDSVAYLALSAIFIVGSIVPWCVMMGATFPLMMEFVRQADEQGERSFSLLYLANVIGAMTGVIATAVFLVEIFGFTRTYEIAAVINFIIAAVAFVLGRRHPVEAPALAAPIRTRQPLGWIELVLFSTGFISLAMEVVWTRAFTFVLHTTIYAFAMILATYLLATWLGSALYRAIRTKRYAVPEPALLVLIGLAGLIPPLVNDPWVHHLGIIALASIAPICLALGYLTPKLIDDHGHGDPARAGRAYSINILGGILGPLAAGYLMLPYMDVREAQILLALPLILLAVAALVRGGVTVAHQAPIIAVAAGLAGVAAITSHSYEEGAHTEGPREVHRDYSASVVSFGEGFDRGLLVNGVGIARLTPITKVMAHLSFATQGNPQSAVAICFGMGTTLRSMQSWGVHATGIDLSRAVIESFGFYHDNAAAIEADPNISIVADDGRRFLLRTKTLFDVIAVDPPPPPEAAGSSLLYSVQFYDVVKQRLRPGGVFHQWIPTGDEPIMRAIVRTLHDSFPYVIFYRSIEDWGLHALASMTPVKPLTPEEFLNRLPPRARRDLMEWYPGRPIEEVAQAILSRRTDIGQIVPDLAATPLIQDDHPYNEYYVLRHRGLIN
jgi:spermidine synthase